MSGASFVSSGPASSLQGVVMVLLASVLWGTTGTAHSLAPVGMSAYWVGALRLLMAAVFFVTLCMFLRAKERARVRTVFSGATDAASVPGDAALAWPRLVLCALCMAGYNMSFFAGLKLTGVGLGTAVAIGSSPIWAGVLQACLVRKLPHAAWWVGTAIGIAGGAMMALDPHSGGGATDAALTAESLVSGLLLCLLAGLCYGSYAIVSQPLILRHGAARVNAWVFGVAAGVSVPVAALLAGWVGEGGASVLQTSAVGWAVVVYLGVVATGVAYLLFSVGLRSISAATGVALSKAEPVAAFVLAIVVVGESPGWQAVAGLVLVLVGLWIVVRSEMKAG